MIVSHNSVNNVARVKYLTIRPNQMCYKCFVTSLTEVLLSTENEDKHRYRPG